MDTVKNSDKIIFGAGLYGLYAALFCARRGQTVTVLEREEEPFTKATYINQARVHMGYHYPRSLSTAMKSAGYFKRFARDYEFCIHKEFEQIYATSANFSWTNAEEFQKFCRDADIMCMQLPVDKYFNQGVCDGAFLTKEYTYDAQILKQFFLDELVKYTNVSILYQVQTNRIYAEGDSYYIETNQGTFRTGFVLNATYASVNQILNKVEGLTEAERKENRFALKYELCEIILCEVNDAMQDIGITVMDGPFFSIMPFGKTGLHSLTSVTFTPHKTCYDSVPTFPCTGMQQGLCEHGDLGNCNDCIYKPESAWNYMSALAHKYVKEEYGYSYKSSLFSMKPILMASEIDDSRPTVIRTLSSHPAFVSVLSGKINTVYDLDAILE